MSLSRTLGRMPQRALRWAEDPPSDFSALPPFARWDRALWSILPVVFAISTGLQVIKYIVTPEWIGFDASLYTAASRAWLAGGDPWSAASNGYLYAAPPPTLLLFAPFTLLPDWLAASVWVLGSIGLALWAAKSLGNVCWIIFWPIVDGCLSGNPDVAVLALLVVGRQRFGGLAPILKIYAVFPLLAERRWRSISIVAVLLVVTAPLLPWSQWATDTSAIARTLEANAQTSSITGNIPFMIIGAVALLSMGIRRAGWLLVPVLWPWTQPHYLAVSVPALTPTLAIMWSVPYLPPIVTLASVVFVAVGFRLFPSVQGQSRISDIATGAGPRRREDITGSSSAQRSGSL